MLDAKEIGRRILGVMGNRDLSIKDVADLLYVNKQAVYHWIWGKSVPSIENMVQLSVILNCSLDYLIKGVK